MAFTFILYGKRNYLVENKQHLNFVVGWGGGWGWGVGGEGDWRSWKLQSRMVLQTYAYICNRTNTRITETTEMLRILQMRSFTVSIISLIFGGDWKCFVRARHAVDGEEK